MKPEPSGQTRHAALTGAALLLLPLLAALLCSWPVLDNRFTYDDQVLIVANPRVHDFSHLAENLTRDHFHSSTTYGQGMGYYRPLVKLGFMIQYQLFGADPRGYHAVSVALFLACVAACFLLFLALGARPRVASAGALLLAVNPAQAESVALVASQADLLAMLGTVAALYCHVRHRRDPFWAWLAAALGCTAVALASKESAVLIVLLLPLYDLADAGWCWSRLRRRLPALAGHAALVAGYAGLRLALGILPIQQSMNSSALQSVAASAKTAVAILLRALVPPLWSPHLHNVRPGHGAGELLLWLVPALAVATLAALTLRRRWAGWRWGLLLWLLPVLPVLPNSLIHTSTMAEQLYVSDRWVLLPAAGAGLLWATLLHNLSRRAARLERVIFPAACVVLALALGLEARLENASFRDETTRMLYEAQIIRHKPHKTTADRHQLLAVDALAAVRRNDRPAAVRHYAHMARLKPGDHTVRHNLALLLMQTGQLDRALYHAWIAVYSASPDGKLRLPRSDAFIRHRVDKVFLLGLILHKKGRRSDAERYFRWCLKMNPAHTPSLQQLRRTPGAG